MPKRLLYGATTIATVLLLAWLIFYKAPKGSQKEEIVQARPTLPANSAALFSADKFREAAATRNSTPVGANGASISSKVSSAPTNMQSTSATGYVSSTAEPRAKASFQIDQQAYHLKADQFGAFQRVPIKANQQIPVSVQFTKGGEGDPVVVQVEDGGSVQMEGSGSLPGGQVVEQTTLDNQLAAHFTFQAGTQEGIYRVAVRRGGETQTVQFWVGPIPNVRS